MWHVYQLRSDTQLLYVGYSRWLKHRLSRHRRDKSWWPEVTDIQTEEFATEDEARQREKEIWRAGQPKHNRRNPFVTPEEGRVQDRRPYARRREYEQARNRDPEHRRHKQDLENVRRRRRGGRRGWQQSGPALFD